MWPVSGLTTSAGVLARKDLSESWQVAQDVADTTVWFMFHEVKLVVLVWQESHATPGAGMCPPGPVAGLTTTAGVPGKDLPVSWQVAQGVIATLACCVVPICQDVNVLVLVWQLSHDAVAGMWPGTWPSPGPEAPWQVRQAPAPGAPVVAW